MMDDVADVLPPGTRVVSCTITGEITNRIPKPRSARDKPIKEHVVRTQKNPNSFAAGGKGLYRQNPARRGHGCKVVCVSFVPADLVELDQLAAKQHVNRSEMVAILLEAYRAQAKREE